MYQSLAISSPQNPRIKTVVKLRQRSHRDDLGLMIVEGYRELKRALDNAYPLVELYACPALFQGSNEHALIEQAVARGASLYETTEPVFRKMAYRDRPEGLLAMAPCVSRGLAEIPLTGVPLILVAESIEKPGNLGTILRTADAAGVDGVIVCDRCTDINNPNVVRASIGTIFSLTVAEASTTDTLTWLREQGIAVVAASPHVDRPYTDLDLKQPTALVVGSEQYGLSERWLTKTVQQVRIPMYGQADSLNVAAATTILLYEAVRQRRL